MKKEVDVLVVGGGVIGVCAAYFLLKAGRSVTLLERDTICSGCSQGNSGLIVPSHGFPLAVPGVIGQALKWMLNPESPFYIRPRFDPALFSWLLQFRGACTRERMLAGIHAMVGFSRASRDLYDEIIPGERLACGYQKLGSFLLFRTREGMAHGEEEAALLEAEGVVSRSMSGVEVHEMDPAVRQDIAGGIYYEGDAHFDPAEFVAALAKCVESKGGTIEEHAEVLGMDSEGGTIKGVQTPDTLYQPGHVVLAGGAWSPGIARSLPLKLPIQPAKGYSVTFANPGVPLKYPQIMAEARAGVNPMGSKLRIAGTLEMTGIDLSINHRRVRAIVRAVDAYLEGIDASVAEENPWCGMRPCTPDGLPVIGTPSSVSNLTIAAGHAMMGMTMGPATGKLVTDLLCDRDPVVDPAPFRPERFE